MSYLATLGKLSVTKASTKTNVAVSTFYNDKPVVIYFIRRFGCAICRWSVKDYQKLVPILADKVNLVVVAPEWHGYDDFVKGAYLGDIEMYIDEDKALYKAIGFNRYNAFTVMGALVDSKVLAINKMAKNEGIEGNFSGDKLTKGGLIVVDKGGEHVLFEFKQESAGDHCPPADILKGQFHWSQITHQTTVLALNMSPDLLNSTTGSAAPECSDACAL